MKPDDKTPLRFVSRMTGDLKLPPRKLRLVFQCPTCGAWLERGPEFWLCPYNGEHLKAVPDDVLVEVLRAKMGGYRRYTPEGIVRVQKAVCKWRNRILTRRLKLWLRAQVSEM